MTFHKLSRWLLGGMLTSLLVLRGDSALAHLPNVLRPGESLTLLNDQTVTLREDTLVIADHAALPHDERHDHPEERRDEEQP